MKLHTIRGMIDRRTLFVVVLVTSAVVAQTAEAQQHPGFAVQVEGGFGFGAMMHQYEGPAGDDEFITTNGGRLYAMASLGRTWVGYLSYTHSNRPLDNRSQNGDFDRYALDAIGYRAYVLGVGYKLPIRNTSEQAIFGAGLRLAGVRNNLENRVPPQVPVAELGYGLGIDMRARYYIWHRLGIAAFVGGEIGVDLVPLQAAEFAFRRGVSGDLLWGLAFRVPGSR